MSRKVQIEVRFSRLELHRIRRAAKRAGVTVEEWCLRQLRKAEAVSRAEPQSEAR